MRAVFILLAFASLLVLQSGCTSWPEHGAGGMAEHHLDTYIPVETDHKLKTQHGLRFDFELLRRQLDILVLEGAEYCFPASVIQGREKEQRIARELQGKLFYDAANGILIQRHKLALLERQLDAVKQVCRPPQHNPQIEKSANSGIAENDTKLQKTLLDLLNSDNQFAVNSSQLNPKYVSRLAEAAAILRQHKVFQLRIIGHTDFQGAAESNMHLSLRRAQQVARYLNVMGISPSRITSDAMGENEPLFIGKEPHIRLVNRRVTIELINISKPSPTQTSKQLEH